MIGPGLRFASAFALRASADEAWTRHSSRSERRRSTRATCCFRLARRPRARAPYVGSWYLAFPEVCATAPEEGDGLLTCTAREFIGLENRCRIVRATPRSNSKPAPTDHFRQCVADWVQPRMHPKFASQRPQADAGAAPGGPRRP